MSVEAKANGCLRLRCSAADCERLFVPRKALLDAKQLRVRAQLFGWKCTLKVSTAADRAIDEVDLCPEHA